MTERFTIKPTLPSLVILASVLGLCGGAIGGVFWSIKFFIEGDTQSGLAVIFLSPFAQSLQFAFITVLAYPLVPIWNRKVRPLVLEGECHKENSKEHDDAP